MANGALNVYKHYVPSVGAAVAFTIIFGALTIAHAVFITLKRRWFSIIVVIGGIFEFAGHAARIYTKSHTDEIPPYAIQMILILLAPILFAAGIYMFLGRIIRATGYSSLSLIRPSWITKIFVLGDILCFLVQLVGAGKLIKPKTPQAAKDGENIILGGLVLQIIIFAFFVAAAFIFHRRYRVKSLGSKNNLLEQQLYSLYICSILILIRSIFRLAEYKGGQDGYLMAHEWPVYVFDVGLMAIVMGIALNWYRGSLDAMDSLVIPQESIQLRE